MKNETRLAVTLVVGLLGTLPLDAAGPFVLKRTTAAQGVETAPPLATLAVSPFDDAAGLLDDGASYYYAVYDAAGNRVVVSLHVNSALHSLRVAFDDGDPQSALADEDRSEVHAAPSTILADGSSAAVVTILPRDGSGVPLGSGLSIALDTLALWPGRVAGTLVDRGDGSYVAHVVSLLPGSGTVVATVEGVELGTQPALVYEEAGNASLREQAMHLLDALGAPGGPVESTGVDASLDAVHNALERMLAGQNDTLTARVVLKDAVDALVAGQADPQVIDELLDVLRMLAVYYLQLAETTCGACTLCAGQTALDEGDAERRPPHANPSKAANRYGKAVNAGMAALDTCGSF
ncbi:MAG TPA: invasin domain 3-containing protein [Candidatus Polarisedimenticolaceae bacterium]|nr:invasin domain 3-containing protein [Candidatus Polarisedimenticolaceae bacterium]